MRAPNFYAHPGFERAGLRRVLGLGMQCRDCRLQLIGPDPAGAQRLFDERQAFVDLAAIPQRAVLVLQSHQGAFPVDPRPAARSVQQHQGEQADALRFMRVDVAQHAGQANGFGAQLAADQGLARGREIAFVEDQVDHRLHRRTPLRQGVIRRNLEGDARFVDLALRSDQTLSEGGFRHEKRPRDLAGRQAA